MKIAPRKKHAYAVFVRWSAGDGDGTATYRSYSRDHSIGADGKAEIEASSDPAFRGDASRYNPEELLVASLSSCHMLWYLHLCAMNGVVVVAYRDDAAGDMEENPDGSGQFARVDLRPDRDHRVRRCESRARTAPRGAPALLHRSICQLSRGRYARDRRMPKSSEREQLETFIARFSPEIAARARGALATMRERLPGAVEMIYDNAYALVVGFSPTERPSDAVFSIVIYPRKVSLCFLRGVHVPDPDGLLLGGGNLVRHIRIEDDATLNKRPIRALVRAALEDAGKPFDAKREPQTVIRAISKNRRPRR